METQFIKDDNGKPIGALAVTGKCLTAFSLVNKLLKNLLNFTVFYQLLNINKMSNGLF
jgi:hypothetical protein